jgi:hypothetical protein
MRGILGGGYFVPETSQKVCDAIVLMSQDLSGPPWGEIPEACGSIARYSLVALVRMPAVGLETGAVSLARSRAARVSRRYPRPMDQPLFQEKLC